MKVTRRRLVLDADPPTKDCPYYTIRFKGRVWLVEQAEMLELYQLSAVSDDTELV